PDLRNLDEVLQSSKGVIALKAGLPLEISLKASRGDERLLREALVVTEQKLKEATGLIVTRYHGEPDLLKNADAISRLANDVFTRMNEISQSKNSDNGQKKTSRRN